MYLIYRGECRGREREGVKEGRRKGRGRSEANREATMPRVRGRKVKRRRTPKVGTRVRRTPPTRRQVTSRRGS